MELEVVPIYSICAGLFFIGIFFTFRLPPILLGCVALALIVYTLYLHISLFSLDYKTMSMGGWVQGLAPTLMIGAVVIVVMGYIILFFKKGKQAPALPVLNSYEPPYTKESTTTQTSPSSTTTRLGNTARRNYLSALDRLI
jgi:hypothetical protein